MRRWTPERGLAWARARAPYLSSSFAITHTIGEGRLVQRAVDLAVGCLVGDGDGANHAVADVAGEARCLSSTVVEDPHQAALRCASVVSRLSPGSARCGGALTAWSPSGRRMLRQRIQPVPSMLSQPISAA